MYNIEHIARFRSVSELISINKIYYDPFPFGYIQDFFDFEKFMELSASFPSHDCLMQRSDLGNKMVLNEHRNTSDMRNFLLRSDFWRGLYLEIKSPGFAKKLLGMFSEAGIRLGVDHLPIESPNLLEQNYIPSPDVARDKGRARLEVRVEFFRQSMPGGHHLPHTDRPGKLLTLLIGVNDNAWPTPEIGCLSICRPRQLVQYYNYSNKYLDFDDVDEIQTLAHQPNCANFLVKTHNSLHAVFPRNFSRDLKLEDRKTFVIQLYVFPMPIR
jgi:hypothetical protein